ncbi:MAG: HEAT repeat domain-containing protein [Planctomycetota bacterium]
MKKARVIISLIILILLGLFLWFILSFNISPEQAKIYNAGVKVNQAKNVSELKAFLMDKDPYIRGVAIKLLADKKEKEALPAAINALNDKERFVKIMALEALDKIADKDSIPALLNLLENQESYISLEAALLLYKLGAQTEAKTKLLKLIYDPQNYVQEEAINSLGKLGVKEAIPELRKCLTPNNSLRIHAAMALGRLNATESIPELLAMMERENSYSLYYVISCTATLGITQEITPILIKKMNGPTLGAQYASIRALGDFKVKQVVPDLIKLLNDPNDLIRSEAAEALGKIGEPEAIPELKKLLADIDGRNVRKTAQEALRQLGVPDNEIEDAKKK